MNKAMKCAFLCVLMLVVHASATAQEITVLGSQEDVIALLDADRWWEKRGQGQQLLVPHNLQLAITERWRKETPNMLVATKKDLFYSAMLPLILHANQLVLDRREKLQQADASLARGEMPSSDQVAELRSAAVLLRILPQEDADQITDAAGLRNIIKEALYRLDVIPPGLALGQAAYESGYATSRFAVQGNALFGQWDFGGEGLLPQQQRKELGDYRVASFQWPFDSVRAYYLNLSSHPAYEEFRQIRSRLKESGKPLRSLALADGLRSYSERGQAYVDILKGIIKTNRLDAADDAMFREEPIRFIIGASDPAAAEQLRADIEKMRESGELQKIIDRMRLE